MDTQLNILIDKIKQHGIEEGEKNAKEIVLLAENESTELLNNAQTKADALIAEAKQEADSILRRGTDALKQAQRDLLLVVENKLVTMCDKFVKQSTEEVLSGDNLKEIITTALSNWSFSSEEAIFVHLSKEHASKITSEAIAGAIKAQGATVSIKIDDSIAAGFKISKGSDSNFSFDFTSEAISAALSVFLTPNIQGLLQ